MPRKADRRSVVASSLAGVLAVGAAEAAPGGARAKGAVKVIALISAKPGLSRADFIRYYETHHAPLIRRLMPTIGDYRRNYLDPAPLGRPAENGPGFDVITELWFDTEEDYAAFRAAGADPRVTSQIRADEVNFLDSARTRLHVVQEHASLKS